MIGESADERALEPHSTMNNRAARIAAESLPSIAVGVLSYNRAAEVLTSLEIFLESDYPPEKLRLIVIDNASSDGTKEQVEARYGDRVEVMRLPENIGAVARNRVMLTAEEPYVFVFDEDCAPEHPGTLRGIIEFMEANPYFGALCFRSINLYTEKTEYGDFVSRSRRRLPNGIAEGVYVIGNGMCFRSEAIQRTAGYDERMFWGDEETTLAYELLYHQIPIAFSTEFALIHRHAPRAIGPARELTVYTRNSIWSCFKYFPIPLAIAASATHTFRRYLMAIVKRKPGGVRAINQGLRHAMEGLGEVIANRRPIPISAIARNNRWFITMFYSAPEVPAHSSPPIRYADRLQHLKQRLATMQQAAIGAPAPNERRS